MNLLECTSLSKTYGKKKALNSVNLNLESGKIIGLLGPNGSGKTTFIKLINGLLQPTSGSVLVDGKEIGINTKSVVSYLPDREFLNSWMTVEQEMNYYNDFFPDFRYDLAKELFSKSGIDISSKIKTLSKGNKEKVCLILVMSRDAKLFVLDEPIAGVDPAARDYIMNTILKNHSKDSSVLISTHLIKDIQDYLDDVIFIQNGEIFLHKNIEEIKSEYNKDIDELFREMYRW